MSAVDSPQQRPPMTGSAGPGKSSGASSPHLDRLSRSPGAVAVVVCVALAALSAAVLPTVPSYDPWSWIVWGHELTDPHLSFIVSGGPSWKPLPVMFTTVWGLFGAAAPTLWVITARAGGLLGVWGAYRLAHRLAGGAWAGVLAGVLAAVFVTLTQDWFYYFLHGTSEPMLIAATIWFVDRLLDGRRTQAFLIAVAASLIRPEWWPFIGLYAWWLLWRDPSFRRPGKLLMLVGCGVAIPALWFVPPWVTTGHPFLAASQAADYNGHLGSDVLRTVVGRGVNDQVLPALIGAAAAVLIGWLRHRDRALLAIGLGVAGWWLVVVVETLKGYPGLERFFLPGVALTCVLGGVGFALVAQLAQDRLGGRFGWAGVAVAAVLIALSIPLATSRISAARAAFPAASRTVDTLHELDRVIAAAGGRDAILPCRSSFAAINHAVQTAMAWKLHVTLERVGTKMNHPGVDFIGPHDAVDGGVAPISRHLVTAATVANVGGWRVVQVIRPGHVSACVGR